MFLRMWEDQGRASPYFIPKTVSYPAGLQPFPLHLSLIRQLFFRNIGQAALYQLFHISGSIILAYDFQSYIEVLSTICRTQSSHIVTRPAFNILRQRQALYACQDNGP